MVGRRVRWGACVHVLHFLKTSTKRAPERVRQSRSAKTRNSESSMVPLPSMSMCLKRALITSAVCTPISRSRTSVQNCDVRARRMPRAVSMHAFA